jgi:hypothetical protein
MSLLSASLLDKLTGQLVGITHITQYIYIPACADYWYLLQLSSLHQ